MDRDLSKLSIDPAARERRGSRRGLFALLGVAAVVVAVLIVWALAGDRSSDVRVASVREARAAQTAVLNAGGYVTPRRKATVAAKITGKITQVLIDEGAQVEAGQVLARLEDVEAMAAYRASEAQRAVAAATVDDVDVRLANARRTLERARELHTRELVSKEALENAETSAASYEAQATLARKSLRAAEQAVAIAKQNVENCIVRAPFAGVVVSKDAQPGEMVSPVSAGGGYTRTGIATIVDMSSLEIEVDVNESYIARVVPGQRAEAVLDAYPDWGIPCKVRTVIPTADRQKATVKVRIAFDKLDPRILPDMGVKVSFMEESEDSADSPLTLVPREAVRREADRTFSYVVKNGRVERRAVRVGRDRGSEVEILAGLRRGEQVVTSAQGELKDGQRVSVQK
ncbi:MAG: efflux RND transporter periplasmic adaptor subunit [Candidatus Eisenbacteria bacterium]|nr:efflux RND transporter periplasmic adaptor subunit [Candidatus Eisenbacteria bacterium]